MCGISGFIDLNKNSSEDILNQMSESLVHRGPDGSGLDFFETPDFQVGLAHRRLSILDLSDSGKQPMKYGKLWITFNGEVFNFKEIRAELEKTGQKFISHSDTEVILHAHAQWGIKCVEKFIGMFIFVIYDMEKNELVCVRDRVGVKPFYYYWFNDLFLFGSELKCFHKHPGFTKELNLNAVAAFIQFGNVPTPHCIFNNCYKLTPGHYLKFGLLKRELEIIKYWDVYNSYNKPKLDISFEEAKSETEKILTSAAEYRMISDVPVGIFLSGGFDSTCLTALLQRNRAEKLKTYTIGVPDIGLDEAPSAKLIADHLGTDHYEYYCTQKDALELIPTLPYYYDEPFADQSAIPTMLVSKMARKNVTVALSADGGDEVFAGYNRYGYLMKEGKWLNQVPGFIRGFASGVLKNIPAHQVPFFKNKYNFQSRYQKLKFLLNDPSPKNIMLRLSRQFSDEELDNIFIKKTSPLDTAFLSEELKPEYFTPLSYIMAIDYQTYLRDDILQKVDRASMSQGLEARGPFLDHRIIEWAARLPDHYKYYNHTKKFLLKEIVYKYVPKNLMNRPKMGFAVPIDNWLMRDLREQVLFYLDINTIVRQGIFDPSYVQKLVAEFFSGKKELALKLWYFLMFQMWYEKWMK